MADLDRMATRAEPATRKEFVAVWRLLRDKYAPESLFLRILTEKRSNLLWDIPWQGLVNDLYVEYRRILLKLFEDGGRTVFQELPRKVDRPPAFNLKHPEAEAWARRYAARLVEGLTQETQRAMADAIAEMIRRQIPPEQGARLLRQMLGLTRPYARAVVNFQSDLRERGYADSYIQSKADEYSRRLLNHRARTVARTETLRALQEGQRQGYQQAVEQGVLVKDRTRRQWVTANDERVCPICGPMDGQLTTLDEPWQTAVGPLDKPTDSHPQCRCAVVLVFPDASGQFPERNPRSHDTGQPLIRRTLRPPVKDAP